MRQVVRHRARASTASNTGTFHARVVQSRGDAVVSVVRRVDAGVLPGLMNYYGARVAIPRLHGTARELSDDRKPLVSRSLREIPYEHRWC